MDKLMIANLPTNIEKVDFFRQELHKSVFIKRDDQTGMATSGNKIRKLEYLIKDAQNKNCDYLITNGGVQSNHARATAVIAAKYKMNSLLILKESGKLKTEGNLFFDKLVGAKIKMLSEQQYQNLPSIIEELKEELTESGHNPYVIPMGGSDGLGALGYVDAYYEILRQEEQLGIEFDTIVVTDGSGGTYAGLLYGNKEANKNKTIIGMSVLNQREQAVRDIVHVLEDMNQYRDNDLRFSDKEINIIDRYIGLGYGKSQLDELKFMEKFAREEGIILDPVYTGKSMYGLYHELKNGNLQESQNILFIHTGGMFGWTDEKINMLYGSI
ncbi:D-cysteine desulfhydrase [Neobacillus rhizosphaerae]|uniref:D-cysteine desulfhydrase n=1 Tax=Neobacillus rhizosphaerae TaxID=2880965 RepID=A0ABN8KXW8_9BACI|nr:D-cysteine desulfhydrase family protein [Neobacillus rhizosphaerae]CAH2717454.1 D-cysteine desulfhydrase [Neobacillus rhizosphaerae]